MCGRYFTEVWNNTDSVLSSVPSGDTWNLSVGCGLVFPRHLPRDRDYCFADNGFVMPYGFEDSS